MDPRKRKGNITPTSEILTQGAKRTCSDGHEEEKDQLFISEQSSDLLSAVKSRDSLKVSQMLESWEDSSLSDILHHGDYLYHAILEGDFFMVQALLFHGASVIDIHGKNLLLTAMDLGNVNIIEYLIMSCDRCVNMVDDFGNSPLISCQSLSGSVTITKHLLSRMNLTMINHQNKAGETALMKAIKCKSLSNMVQIIKAGANVNLYSHHNNSAISLSKESGWDHVLLAVAQQTNPIAAAVSAQDVGLLKLLLMSKQLNVNKQNCYGSTALSYIFESKCLKEKCGKNPFTELEMQMIGLLLNAGADMFHDQGADCVCVGSDNQLEHCHNTYTDIDSMRDTDWCFLGRFKTFPLFKACRYGDVGLVRFMISKSRQQLFCVNKWRVVLVMIAIEARFPILEVLSSHLRELFQQNKPHVSEFQSCLSITIKRWSVPEVSTLLNLLLDLPDGDFVFGHSFNVAAHRGDWSIFLLLKGVKLEQFNELMKSNDKATFLLQSACKGDCFHIVEFILQACVERNVTICNQSKDFPIEIHPLDEVKSAKVAVLLFKYSDAIQGLLPKNFHEAALGEKALLHAFSSSPMKKDLIDILLQNGVWPSKDTMLTIYRECKKNRQKLSYVCSTMPDRSESDDSACISQVLREAVKVGDLETLKWLVAKGADIEYKQEMRDQWGRNAALFDDTSPLCIATEKNHTPIIQFLVEQGADIESKDRGGNTPLGITIQKGNLPIVDFLLIKGANIESKNRLGNTPLDLATQTGQLSIVNLLLKKGANTESRNSYDLTPLMVAIHVDTKSKISMFEALIKAGADVNAINGRHGIHACGTALEILLQGSKRQRNSNLELISLLLKHGGDISSHYAVACVHRSILMKEFFLLFLLVHQGGFSPSHIIRQNTLSSKNPFCDLKGEYYRVNEKVLSPLFMAFLCGEVKLARDMVDSLYVTSSDVNYLPQNTFLRHHLKSNNYVKSLEYLDELAVSAPSLMQLSFAKVSDLIGSAPARRKRVDKLNLPAALKRLLMYQTKSQAIGDQNEPQSSYCSAADRDRP